ncbi:TatD family hydrolase [Conservatibacter flavescens]|uniref:Deoxyribonuclease n=1 Tax=Conservatibacter flavescens TaxID=28161 RepID=A0A2M8S3I0_9PAST|nr:TatD family hydrolase [Conservatibacter flavescens]PJG85704.1 deoxyribonuclease [Conservatibacter flavescens]
MYCFFDTHTHLDYVQESTQTPLAQLIDNASAVGIQKILIVAVFRENFKTIEKMTALFPEQLRYGLGLHPLYIRQHQQSDLDLLAKQLARKDPLCTAIAEIGLERAIPELVEDDLWRKQCEYLEAQLQLAKQFHLPINLHSRKSHEQLFSFLKRIQLPKCGVVHGFAGSYDQAKRFVDLGYKIGVGGTITYARANKTRQTIAKLPLDALLLETDSPDMPVFGFQGQPNRPERLYHVFQSLCALRSESPEHIADTIWKNSQIFS